ncbi:MAG: pilus assembly protein [Sulfuricaulis sp.]
MTQIMKRNLVILASLLAIIVPVTVFSVTTINLASQPIGNVAKPALSTANLSVSGGKLFDVRFTVRDPASGEIGYSAANYNVNNIWSGDLLANAVDTSGVITALKWQARVKLEAQNWDTERKIFTSGGGSGVLFRSANLTTASLLSTIDSNATTAGKIVNWVRGSHTDEVVNGGTLRTRQITVSGTTTGYSLGDIVHSSPVYVGAPSESYTFANYAAFRSNKVNRVPMVYVGANDGMLHAFNATVDQTDSGKEVFAYVPNPVLGSLYKLTGTSYLTNHAYFADGSPTAGDVCFSSCSSASDWHTVLVSGLNGGGKAIFAIDVTDPVADMTTETVAASKFLWQFTDTSDLGYTFSKPEIARLPDGTWVAIFGNGYNSTNDSAVLFVVNIQTGALIQKITTPGTGSPNGLSSPTLLDTNADNVVDYVYAGDLQGNLWKFNFTAASAASGGVTISYSNNPLVKVAQDISSAPKVAQNLQDGGYLVAFGTGRLLESGDKTDTTTNYMYGIFDRSGYTPSTGWGSSPNLKESTVSTNLINTTYLRFILNTTTPSGTLAGWKLRMPSSTERIINEPIIRSGRVTFTTVDPGTQFNRNWRMGIDYLTGAAPAIPFFDTNGNGVIDINDKVDHDEDSSTPTLVAIGQDEALGVVSSPVAARIAGNLDVVYVTHAVDAIISTNPFNDPGLSGGHFDVDNFDAVGVSTCTPGTGTTTTTDVTEANMTNAEKTAHPAPDQSTVTTTSGSTTTTTQWNTKKDDSYRVGKKKITTVTTAPATGIAKCHIHQYDDSYNVNGINMIKSVNTYDMDSALIGTGLVSDKLRELDRSDYGLCSVPVIISLVNPDPVMTVDPVTGGAVEAGRIKLNHSGLTTPIDVYTTGFNALPAADRTSTGCGFTQLSVSFTNINALRATEPGAAQNKAGSCGGASAVSSKGYRDGALVIRATRVDTGVVVYETAIYEHLKADTLLAPYDSTAVIGCGADAEQYRQYKDPTKFVGSTPGSSGTGTGVTVGGGGSGVGFSGSAGTGRGVYTGTDLGQHNWRELILFP